MSYEEDLGAIGAQVDGRIDSLIDQVTVETLRADQAETEKAQAEQELAAAEAEIARLEDELADCQGGEDPDPEEPEEPEPTGLTLTVEPGDGQARLTWTVTGPTDTITGYQVGRDGTDTGGYGPWSTIDPPTSRERTFLALRNDTMYTLSVAALAGDETLASVSVQVTPQGATNPDPDPDPPTPGTWLSGAGTQEVGQGVNCAKYLGDFRGRPVEIGCTWPNTPHMYGIQPYVANSWANFPGAMVLCVQPETDAMADYTRVARGDFDAWWAEGARTARTLRAGLGQTFVAPFYEYNGDWMKWSVIRTAAGMAAFQAAFERVSRIWRENFPGVRVVLPASMNRDTPAAMRPNPASFDLWGGTTYNAWQPWSTNGAGAIAQMEVYRKAAEALGKPIGITEWSNSGNRNAQGGGGEAPQYMRDMHTYFRRHAGNGPGQVAFDTLFNIGGYALDHLIVRTNGQGSTTQPLTAAAYAQAWRQG